MTQKKQKLIGLGMMVPAAAVVVYLALSSNFWVIAGAVLSTGVLAMVGYNMYKGASLQEAVQDTVKDIKDKV